MTTAAITLVEWKNSKFQNIPVDQAKLDFINKSEILKSDIRAYDASANTEKAKLLTTPAEAKSGSYKTPAVSDGKIIEGFLQLGEERIRTPEDLFRLLAHELGHFKVEEPGALIARARRAALILNDKESYADACNMTEGFAKYNEVKARSEVLAANQLKAFSEGRELTFEERYLRDKWTVWTNTQEGFDYKTVEVFEDLASKPRNPPMTQDEARNSAIYALGENNKINITSTTGEDYLQFCRRSANEVLGKGASSTSSPLGQETLETTLDANGRTVSSTFRTLGANGLQLDAVFDAKGNLIQQTAIDVVDGQRSTTQIQYADDDSATARVTSAGLVVTYTQDAAGNWKPASWTQDNQTYTGDDLSTFIANLESSSNASDASSSQNATAGRLNQALASASGDNAAGVTTARDTAASLDTLGTRLGRPDVSDRWAPAVLGGQLPASVLLSRIGTSTFLSGQAGIAQARINTLQNQPSIFTVTVMGGGFSFPLVIDLDDDGLNLVSLDRSNASFDANLVGTAQTVGWVGPREGILVLDKNGNGAVDNAGEWFGQKFSVTGTPPATNQDGFKALATLATAGATTLSANTSQVNTATGKRYFDELQVWVDANQDGVTDAGELRSLVSLGITSIDLNPQAVNKPVNGNTILSKAGYTTADGKRHAVMDVGLATELAPPLQGDAVRPASAAALAFAEYAGKGYAAMAAGQARAIAAAVQSLPANEAAAIAALQSKFTLPVGTGPLSPAALEARAKSRWAVLAGLPATGLNDKIASFIGPDGDRASMPTPFQRINSAPTDIIDVLNGMGTLRAGEVGVANAIDAAATKLSDAQTRAQVANATQTYAARADAWVAGIYAASAWNDAIVSYLNIRDQIDSMAARLPAIQDKLNAVVPQNINLTGHLPDGGTFLTRNDSAIAAEAFRAYAAALQPMAALKVTGDQLLGAVAQSNGYNKVYVGQAGQTTTVESGYNLLVGNRGEQTFTLNSGVDNIAVTSATDNITVNGFQVGDAGDQIQFLAGGFETKTVTIASDGQGNTILTKGAQTVKLVGVDPAKLDLYANLVGVERAKFVNTASGVHSLRGEIVYEGLQHVTRVAASDAGDVLVGAERDSILEGGSGNDTFVITGRQTSVEGGGGTDTVSYAELGFGVQVHWEERINHWDDGEPIMDYYFADTLGSFIEGVPNFTGTQFNDKLSGNDTANVLSGGKGNDTLTGGLGDDTYVFASGDGRDSIEEGLNSAGGGNDIISFAQDVLPSAVMATRTGEDLVLSYGAGDSIALRRWFSANSQSIEQIRFADGASWDAAKLNSLVNAPTVQKPLAAQSATEDAAWTFVLPADIFVATGGAVLGFSASLADGSALPSWLRFDAATRTFSGTPLNADVGNLTLKVIATDPAGGIASAALTVVIGNTNDAPTTGTPAANQDVVAGIQWTYALPADLFKDVDAGDELTYSVTLSDGKALPNWLTFNAANRTFIGKAGGSDIGNLELRVIATDLAGASASQPLRLNVLAKAAGQTFIGTAGNDILTGAAGDDLLNGLGGNDMLNGGDGNDRLDGGTGADVMHGGTGDDTYFVDNDGDVITESAGGGRDTVVSGITIDLATLGAGQIENAVLAGTANLSLTGNALANILTGNAGNNVLRGGAGNDTLIGGLGRDVLIGDDGNDTYVITGQSAIISEYANEWDTVSYAELGQAIQVFWDGVIHHWDDGEPIMNYIFTDNLGSHISGVFNFIGTKFNDQMSGNDGANTITGGQGDDALAGGLGNDTYIFTLGDGKDTIEETLHPLGGGNNVIAFAQGILPSGVQVTHSGEDLVLSYGAEDSITVKRWFGANFQGIEQVRFADGTNWSASKINSMVYGAADEDWGLGRDGNIVTADGHGSVLRGGIGNDIFVINRWNTTVWGVTSIEGSDTVSYAEMGMGVKTEWHNETYFDKEYNDDGRWVYEDFFTDSVGSRIEGVHKFVGSRFNDQLAGDGWSNVFKGGKGDDVLSGDAGNDVYQFGRGDGADTIRENDTKAGNTDLLSFGPGIEANQLWLSRASDDLQIGIIGTSDKVTVQNWYSGSQHRVEQIKTADGKVLLDSQVQNLVQAMASFAPPAAGQTTLPSSYQNNLAPVFAANWH